MSFSLWQRWWQRRTAIEPRRRAADLGLEALEDRLLPSLTPHLLKDIAPGTTSSFPREFTSAGAKTFFAATDAAGNGLWVSDATAAGTVLCKDFDFAVGGSGPEDLTNVNGTVFFSVFEPGHGEELWKSDGTVAGTNLVKLINASYYDASPLDGLTNVNGTLFFSAFQAGQGEQLWRSDGTEAGTVTVKPTSPAPYPSDLTNVNGTLFFVVTPSDLQHGQQLWRSDGTAAGTTLVKQINPDGQPPLGNLRLTNVNGALFFQGNDGTHDVELWKSNGTAAGTLMVKDINPGSAASDPLALLNFKGVLFFQADDGTHGAELWRSNGTAAGTFMLNDINPSSASSFASPQADVSGTLFFGVNDGTDGSELWRTNGTAAGTRMVKDINQGPGGSVPEYGTNVSGTLFFVANDGVHDQGLWESTGTDGGTQFIQDLNGNATTPSPSYLTNTNGTLFFNAQDSTHGEEPWVLGIGLPTTVSTNFATAHVKYGQEVDFTVSVSTGGRGTPTGTVTFDDGGKVLGPPAPLNATGQATFSTTSLSVGDHTVTAAYSGDTRFAGSEKDISFTVDPASFNGINRLLEQPNPSDPPDTMGAIGPNHFVELINGGIAIYTRGATACPGASAP